MDEASLVRSLREGANVSQEELAARLGVSQMWVSRREKPAKGVTRKRGVVSLTDLERIAAALGKRFDPVIRPASERADPLAAAASNASEEAREAAVKVLDALDRVPPIVRRMVLSTIEQAASAAAEITPQGA